MTAPRWSFQLIIDGFAKMLTPLVSRTRMVVNCSGHQPLYRMLSVHAATNEGGGIILIREIGAKIAGYVKLIVAGPVGGFVPACGDAVRTWSKG